MDLDQTSVLSCSNHHIASGYRNCDKLEVFKWQNPTRNTKNMEGVQPASKNGLQAGITGLEEQRWGMWELKQQRHGKFGVAIQLFCSIIVTLLLFSIFFGSLLSLFFKGQSCG